MIILLNIIKIAFLLGFLITIHEGGHFLVAKLCNVKVLEFAIGFGPTIWKKQGKETKYALRLIPLGGFVNLEGENGESKDERAFSNASLLKRILIVAAGATVNILFALIVYYLIASFSTTHISTTVNQVMENYAAASSGILEDDKIIMINNKKVKSPEDISEIVQKSNGEELNIKIRRNDEIIDITLKPTPEKYKTTGIYLYQSAGESTKVAGVVSDSPADLAGLQEGDLIISINNNEVENKQEELVEYIKNFTEDKFILKIKRNNEIKEIELIPSEETAYYIGVVFKEVEKNILNDLYYGGIDTVDFMCSIIDNIKQMVVKKEAKGQLMGPVGISGIVVKTSTIKEYVYILVLISLSLGITNLLPFPPLDGGKILLMIIGAIRRKPISEEIEIQIQLLGFAILIGLSIYITYKDILNLM